MNCAQVNQKIELFVLGELPKSEQVAITAHIATCPTCSAAEADYRLLIARIKESTRPDSIGIDFAEGLHSAVNKEIRSIAFRSSARRIFAITASVAACLLFAFVIRNVWFSSGGRVESVIVNNPSEEQFVESALDSGAPSVLQAWQHRGAFSVPGSMADGVVVRGQNMYLLQKNSRDSAGSVLPGTYVAALDIETGKQKWVSDIQSCGFLLADDVHVYCLAQGSAEKFELVALDASSGKTLWKYPQQNPEPLQKPCRPVLLDSERICWTTNKTVHVLSCADGRPVWVCPIPDGGLLSAAVLVDDNLFVANAVGLHCLDVTTGRESWKLPFDEVISGRGRPLLAASGEEIYASLNFGFGTSRLLGVDLEDQKTLWSRVVKHVTHLYAIDNTLYLRDQNIEALDGATGRLLWTCPATGCNPVTYAEGLAYFVDSSDQGRLVALNRYNGSKVWELTGLKSCNAFIKVESTGFIKSPDGVVSAIVFKG